MKYPDAEQGPKHRNPTEEERELLDHRELKSFRLAGQLESARPWVDLPKMVDLYMSGKLQVDSLVSRTYPLDEINVAYDALGKGEVARSILLYD